MVSIFEGIVFFIRSVLAKKVILQNKKTNENVTRPSTVEENEFIMKKTAPQKDEVKTDEIDEFSSGSESNSSDFITQEGSIFKHLMDELQRIDLIIKNHLEKSKKEHVKGSEDLMGLYITEDEVSAFLQPSGNELGPGYLNERIQISSRAVQENTKSKRLYDLAKLFRLSPFEIEALLICLASELDMRYEKIYAYLQNDVMKKKATVDLVINLLCPSMEERLKAREYFSPEASLIWNKLIYFAGDGQDIPLLSRSIKVDERIVSYLLGSDRIDGRIANFALKIEPASTFKELVFPDDEKNSLQGLTEQRMAIKNPMFFFHGAYGTGKKMAAEAVCRELGTSLFIVNAKILLKQNLQDMSRIIMRESLLQKSSLYIEGVDILAEKEAGIDFIALIHEFDLFPGWIFLAGELPVTPSGILQNHNFIEMPFPIPSFTSRKKFWRYFLNEDIPDRDIEALANKFSFSGGQIKDAISAARSFAIVRNPLEGKITLNDLYRGCKVQSNRNLSSFARSIPPKYSWNDIVLPKDLKEHLNEISGYIRHRGMVYTDWGFDAKLSLGKGLNVLFSGPSGSGKTMAAEVLANEAGLDIYKIDLSTVVSKYIGETEKHLNKIFVEAQTSNAILFFDEADALFGRRSEVKDSHDRYANIEINYLLQKMEEHEGIVILASNFKTNIDEAFLRRMHFMLEFPSPDENIRKKIWQHIFPRVMPVSEDVDYSFLSTFKISGGNIKNIALSAAFLAADDSGRVKMEHIIRATKREFQKIGKICGPGEFGKYYEFVK